MSGRVRSILFLLALGLVTAPAGATHQAPASVVHPHPNLVAAPRPLKNVVRAQAPARNVAVPVRPTPSTAFLKQRGIAFKAYEEEYRGPGVTAQSEVKSLVMEDDAGRPFLVMMPGDRRVDTKGLAARLGVKKVRMASSETAERLTGFKIGSIGPFGLKEKLPIYVEGSVLELPSITVGGGRRGLVIEVNPKTLASAVSAQTVNVAVAK
jgi:Cys-tRNA(Pro) deacylase